MKGINFKIIAAFLGITAILNASFMLLCLPFAWYHNEGVLGIASAMIVTGILGLSLWLPCKNAPKKILKREGYLIVAFGWIMLTLTGSLPYLFTGSITSIPDAIFEAVSGYTTTGASIINDIEALSKGILIWRSATHWIGGMGIIVLTVAILPLLGIGGMQLFMAEAPGPSTDKIHPRITETAKKLWGIYAGLTFVEFILLKLAGMGWFDALNHAMATMSTGGFSTKNASIAYWNDTPMIQYIIIFFMLVAGMNFILTYFALKGNFRKVFKNEEFRYYFFGVLFIAIIITVIIVFFQDPTLKTSIDHPKIWGQWESAFRHAIFQVLAVVTTTGFVTADFTMWSGLGTILMFSLFFLGGSAGSTSGGVKVVRHIIMIKNSFLELKKILHPNAIIPVRYDGNGVSRTIVFNILSFFVLYMAIFILGTVILGFLGLDLVSAIGISASSLGNIGPALGAYSPVDNYSGLSDGATLFVSFLMLVGRLEIFTVLVILTPFFWRKN